MGQTTGHFRDNVPINSKENIELGNPKVANQYVDSNRLIYKEIIIKEDTNNKNSNIFKRGLLASNNLRKLLSQYYNKSQVDYTLKIIKYYFETYKKKMGINHQFIKVMNIYRLAIIINDGWFDSDVLDKAYYHDIELEIWFNMIDRHFETKYKNCDYNINHFFSDRILENRYFEVGMIKNE